MNGMRLKLIIGGLVLVGAVAYLAMAGVSKGWVYYLDVDAYMADTQYHAKRVRLCAKVSEANFESNPAALTAHFDVHGVNAVVPVTYRGVIPQTFKPGVEVVIEGQLDESGRFIADVMLTKCASKYQAEDHAKRLEGDHAQPGR